MADYAVISVNIKLKDSENMDTAGTYQMQIDKETGSSYEIRHICFHYHFHLFSLP